MPELIERANVLKYLTPRIKPETTYGEGYNRALEDVAELVALMPTIEPEVRNGHWEDIPGMNNTVFCSECLAAANKELAMKYKGCPFCLARMDGGADNGNG